MGSKKQAWRTSRSGWYKGPMIVGKKSPGKNGIKKRANTFDHLGKITDRNTLDPTEQVIKL